jgi:hypothetical protein
MSASFCLFLITVIFFILANSISDDFLSGFAALISLFSGFATLFAYTASWGRN